MREALVGGEGGRLSPPPTQPCPPCNTALAGMGCNRGGDGPRLRGRALRLSVLLLLLFLHRGGGQWVSGRRWRLDRSVDACRGAERGCCWLGVQLSRPLSPSFGASLSAASNTQTHDHTPSPTFPPSSLSPPPSVACQSALYKPLAKALTHAITNNSTKACMGINVHIYTNIQCIIIRNLYAI